MVILQESKANITIMTRLMFHILGKQEWVGYQPLLVVESQLSETSISLFRHFHSPSWLLSSSQLLKDYHSCLRGQGSTPLCIPISMSFQASLLIFSTLWRKTCPFLQTGVMYIADCHSLASVLSETRCSILCALSFANPAFWFQHFPRQDVLSFKSFSYF